MNFQEMFYGKSNSSADSMLLLACQEGDEKLFDQAIAEGADANVTDVCTRRRPIHFAVSNCNLDIVKKLVAIKNIELCVADARWWTPLEIASTKGNVEILKVLEDAISPEEIAETTERKPNYPKRGSKSLYPKP